MPRKEGPDTISHQQRCGSCRWHDCAMELSGEEPLYRHYCNHPSWRTNHPDIISGQYGWYIGRDDRTPTRCPVVLLGVEDAT